LLLAGLFLFNPFLASHPLMGIVVVCHPASYRATVGSSELEQFAQPDVSATELLPESQAAPVSALQITDSNGESQHYVEPPIVPSPQTGFSSSLWFRPPPAV